MHTFEVKIPSITDLSFEVLFDGGQAFHQNFISTNLVEYLMLGG